MVRAEDPKDDSDPAVLIAKMGPMMSKIPIEVVNIAENLDLIKGAGATSRFCAGRTGCWSSIRKSPRGEKKSSRRPGELAASQSRR